MTARYDLSDFLDMDVIRYGNEATVAVEYVAHEGQMKPVRLSALGFITDASKSDFEIREEAYHYYLAFCDAVEEIKKCPVCGGNLHMTHAAINGHVWGKCETEGCVAWME